MKKLLLISFSFFLCVVTNAQVTKYVSPNAAINGNGNSVTSPYNDIAFAVNKVKQLGGGEVIILDGTYNIGDQEITINTSATVNTAVTIKPQTPFGVILKFSGRRGFSFTSSSKHITLEGIELYGQTDNLDYWTIVAKAFWRNGNVPRNGGIATLLNGKYITVKNCYIHDWYQKAAEIKDGRYIIVQGNIIHDIATTSLSGGHGIMRQQKGQEFFDDDTPGVYRWDISENLLFRVEQRIYSWVPRKGYITMVIDEGKSILIDDPKDTDGHQESMIARIKNNIVAYGSVVGIRLKSTPGLEVSNNSVFQVGPNADGITDRAGDTNTPQFTDFIFKNNAVQTIPDVFAINIRTAVNQGGSTVSISGNVAMDGKVRPTNQPGVSKLTGNNLFTNPANGDFSINSALNLPATLGVTQTVRNDLINKSNNFGVTVGASDFIIDHLKLTQTILDNIPYVYDGIPGNETVFTNYGNMTANHEKINFNVVNGYWQSQTNSPSTQQFRLNEAYYTWYSNIDNNYPGYDRIRWGSSEIMQDFIFPANWLCVSQIKGLNDHTQINGHDKKLTLDGDILIGFENFTPTTGDSFDLMIADEIVPASVGGNLFDNIIFEGYTPANYTLNIVQSGGKDVLRLMITSPSAIDDLTFNTQKLKAIPNPSSSTFLLETKMAIHSFKMFDIIGRDVTNNINIKTLQHAYQFNTEQLSAGIYLLHADNQKIKIIIEK